jgi:hypothetical protein
VPPIEERESSRFSGYTWKEWQGLAYDERVDCVAYFRIRRRIEMHQADAQEKDIRTKQRRKRKGQK